VQTTSTRCSKYSDSSPCHVKRLYDMPMVIGLWGLAPWTGFWPLIVFFAPLSIRAKIWIFVVSLVMYGSLLIPTAIASGNGIDFYTWLHALPWAAFLYGVTFIALVLTYFILSYVALFQENRKRKALYAELGDAQWRRASYCVVHDQVINK